MEDKENNSNDLNKEPALKKFDPVEVDTFGDTHNKNDQKQYNPWQKGEERKGSEKEKTHIIPPTPFETKDSISSGQTNRENVVRPLRTYEGDVAEVLRQGGSLTKVVLAEQERKIATEKVEAAEEMTTSGANKKLIFSVIFVVAGIAIVGYALLKGNFINDLPIDTPSTEIISDKKIVSFIDNKTRDAVIGEIRAAYSKSNPGINLIELSTLTLGSPIALTTSQTLDLFDWNISPGFERSISKITLGFYNRKEASPFVILKAANFEQAFAGMIDWEENMLDDLAPILNIDIGSLDPLQNPLVRNPFSDEVISNLDARVVKDNTGKIALLYSIVGQQNIIITVNKETLKDLQDALKNATIIK